MKKKICVCITDYGLSNKKYLQKILEAFNGFKNYEISVFLFSTAQSDFSNYTNISIHSFIFNESIRTDLAFQHLNFLKEQFNNIKNTYDIFIGMENDILLKEESIDYFIENTQKIDSKKFAIGFIRYENANGKKWYIDSGNISSVMSYAFSIKDERFYKTNNPHSALWIFTKEQLENLLEIKRDWRPKELEPAITGFYKTPWPGTENGIQKIIPLSSFGKVELHHMPDKYVNDQAWMSTYTVQNEDSIIELDRKYAEINDKKNNSQ